MITNRILNVILGIFAIVVFPCQLVTTLVLGLAVSFTFGLLLLPISLIWALLLSPMVAISWLCNKVPALRDVFGIIFIPWAVFANTFVALMPSMGELENRASKLMLCGSWPFTWEFQQFLSRKLDLESDDHRRHVNSGRWHLRRQPLSPGKDQEHADYREARWHGSLPPRPDS